MCNHRAVPPSRPHLDACPVSAATAGLAIELNRRTRHRTKGAEHTAVTGFGPESDRAGGAIEDDHTGVLRHRVLALIAAVRTGKCAEQGGFHVRYFTGFAIRIISSP